MATVLVTAGPTREHLDDVRYLANGSSGRMGFAIAAAALRSGHEVRLVAGPTEVAPPAGARVDRVVSALEMHAAALRAFEGADIAFGVAAVADFRPAERTAGKPAKGDVRTTIELVANPDVIADLGARKGSRVVVGFALEAPGPAALGRARSKLERKNLDLCVLNTPASLGSDRIDATIVGADGRVEPLGSVTKDELAELVVARALELHEQRTEEQA